MPTKKSAMDSYSIFTYSNFLLVNILLRKFDASLKKEMKMSKNTFFNEKKKQYKKVYVNCQ